MPGTASRIQTLFARSQIKDIKVRRKRYVRRKIWVNAEYEKPTG